MLYKIKYYYHCIRWLFRHRDWQTTRQKYKAMDKEVTGLCTRCALQQSFNREA